MPGLFSLPQGGLEKWTAKQKGPAFQIYGNQSLDSGANGGLLLIIGSADVVNALKVTFCCKRKFPFLIKIYQLFHIVYDRNNP